MILSLKLILSPVLIALVSLAGRRWGPAISGWFLGFPLTSAPISILLAAQYGTGFAAASATGILGGQASVCVFCLAFSYAALKFNWMVSSFLGLCAFFLSTALLNLFTLSLPAAFLILLGTITVMLFFLPKSDVQQTVAIVPSWDLPVRMILAGLFVFLVTTFATGLGPQLSGLVAPFPVFGVILAAFTHKQYGAGTVIKLFRGYLTASIGFACFFLIVGVFLPIWGSVMIYSLATVMIFAINGFFFYKSNIQKGVTN